MQIMRLYFSRTPDQKIIRNTRSKDPKFDLKIQIRRSNFLSKTRPKEQTKSLKSRSLDQYLSKAGDQIEELNYFKINKLTLWYWFLEKSVVMQLRIPKQPQIKKQQNRQNHL